MQWNKEQTQLNEGLGREDPVTILNRPNREQPHQRKT